jgi:ankyrin repeat protein
MIASFRHRRSRGLIYTSVLSCASLAPAWAAQAARGAEQKIDFEADVAPILSERCLSCHNASFQTANLRLDQKELALRGGDSGPVIVPGSAEQSLLIRRISGSELGLRMPPTGKLPDKEIAVLRTWVDQGATWPDEAEDGEPAEPAGVASSGPQGREKELFEALRRGAGASVTRILASDVDLSIGDEFGDTPLMYAALNATPEIVQKLLDHKADPNQANGEGATPLMRAARDFRKVRLLLKAGAEVDTKSANGRTALHVAARQPGTGTALQSLLGAGGDANARDARGVTPLMEAARAGDVRSMSLLVKHGAETNVRRKNGRTALMAAVRSRDLEAVWFLVDRDADVNIQAEESVSSNSRDTALTMAASRAVPGILRALLASDADIHARNAMGYTALMQAACSDYVNAESVRVLLRAGADISAKGVDGETALSLARQRGPTEIVELLLEAEAKSE